MAEMVFDGRVRVGYKQAYVESGDAVAQFDDSFDGQVNGLLGAALPGTLTLFTGTHQGDVGLRVVQVEAAPSLAESHYEDVVEVSFIPDGPDAWVRGFDSDPVCELNLPRSAYRVRLGVNGLDAAYDGVVSGDDPVIDTYELTFWPDETVKPDEVQRVGSDIARERHTNAGD